MTIPVGTATNMGWSMGLPPRDVPLSSFEFGSQASLGIPLVSLILLSLDPKPPLGFHSFLFFF
jgi:hypothetical protein